MMREKAGQIGGILFILILLSLVIAFGLTREPVATIAPTPRPPTDIPPPTATGPPIYHWERFDVTMTVLANGAMRVVEYHQLHFSGRPFTYGFRMIPAGSSGEKYTITEIAVGQANMAYVSSTGREPHTFLVEELEKETVIGWFFPGSIGTQRYEFRYTVQDAVGRDAQGDLVLWPAMPANLGAHIDNGEVIVTAPPGVEIQSTMALVAGGEEAGFVRAEMGVDNQQAVFTLEQPLPAEMGLVVGVRFPEGGIRRAAADLYRRLVDPALETSLGEKGYRPAAVETFSHGIDYFSVGQLEAAIAEFTWAIILERAFAEAYYYRGLANYLLADESKAEADFQQAIAFDPHFEARITQVMAELSLDSGVIRE